MCKVTPDMKVKQWKIGDADSIAALLQIELNEFYRRVIVFRIRDFASLPSFASFRWIACDFCVIAKYVCVMVSLFASLALFLSAPLCITLHRLLRTRPALTSRPAFFTTRTPGSRRECAPVCDLLSDIKRVGCSGRFFEFGTPPRLRSVGCRPSTGLRSSSQRLLVHKKYSLRSTRISCPICWRIGMVHEDGEFKIRSSQLVNTTVGYVEPAVRRRSTVRRVLLRACYTHFWQVRFVHVNFAGTRK